MGGTNAISTQPNALNNVDSPKLILVQTLLQIGTRIWKESLLYRPLENRFIKVLVDPQIPQMDYKILGNI